MSHRRYQPRIRLHILRQLLKLRPQIRLIVPLHLTQEIRLVALFKVAQQCIFPARSVVLPRRLPIQMLKSMLVRSVPIDGGPETEIDQIDQLRTGKFNQPILSTLEPTRRCQRVPKLHILLLLHPIAHDRKRTR